MITKTVVSIITPKHFNLALASLKQAVELEMSKVKSDGLVYNENSAGGISDLSYEKRESHAGVKRVASLHFKMDKEGIKAYRKAAKELCDNPSVELSYTPHFGQSRITFEWDTFWLFLNENKLHVLGGTSLPLLLPPASVTGDLDPSGAVKNS